MTLLLISCSGNNSRVNQSSTTSNNLTTERESTTSSESSSELKESSSLDSSSSLISSPSIDSSSSSSTNISSSSQLQEFQNVTFESLTVSYDGNPHSLGEVNGAPSGTTITYSNKEAKTDCGTYTATAKLEKEGYNSKTLTATLTIKPEKTNMPIFVSSDGTIYFSNGLDNRYVYSIDSESNIKRIDYSTPKEFKYENNSALFISGTPILNSVKEFSDSSLSTLYTHSNISDFAKYSSNIYYFSSNSLTSSKSGIYKVDASNADSEPTVTQIFTGKSDNLAIYNNYLYFTNGNDDNHLYRIDLTTNTSSLFLNEKVHEYIINNGNLYCTVDGTINDYIGYISLSSTTATITKLTNYAGEFLRIKNGYLYYNLTDLSSVADSTKHGIWKINVSNKTETQVLKIESINGFDVDNNSNLLYIDSNDLHLYSYSQTTKTSTDLLSGFTAPEETPFNLGGKNIAYGTKIYYLNMHSGKTLYCFDEVSKTNTKLTDNKVQDFTIYNDTMYFNMVTMLSNNDIYSINLKTGSTAEKISSNDVRNMIVSGDYLYGTHYNFAGVAGGISRMTLDGNEYVKFSEVNGAKNLTVKDNNLYYINCATGQDNGDIEYYDLSTITETSDDLKATTFTSKIKNVKQFIFDGDDIFYMYNGTLDNSIRRTSFTNTDDEVKIASSKTNPNEMILNGNDIYYYSHPATALSSSGFYKVNKSASKDGTQTRIVDYESKYYGSDFAISDAGYLYFLNYIPKLLSGDAHTYQLKLSDYTITKIA